MLGAAGLLPGTGLASGLFGEHLPFAGSPPQCDDADYPPLFRAIRLGQIDLVKSLVQQGADLNARHTAGNTPLQWAFLPPALECVKKMRYYDPDLETHDVEEFFGKQASRLDKQHGYQNCVALLEDSGIDWHSQVRNDGTPFHFPSRIARMEIVRFLVDAGADIEARNDWGGTPLFLAARAADIELLQFVFKLGVDREAKEDHGGIFSFQVAAYSTVEIMHSLIESGIDIHVKNEEENTLLHWAAMNYDASMLKFLVSLGLDPFTKSSKGIMPIHYATAYGCIDSVRYLLALCADVNAKVENGDTSLHWVSDTRVAQLLIDSGTDAGAKGEDDCSPLHYAGRRDHSNLIKTLIGSGADVNAKSEGGFTPLHDAAWDNSRSCLH